METNIPVTTKKASFNDGDLTKPSLLELWWYFYKYQ